MLGPWRVLLQQLNEVERSNRPRSTELAPVAGSSLVPHLFPGKVLSLGA